MMMLFHPVNRDFPSEVTKNFTPGVKGVLISSARARSWFPTEATPRNMNWGSVQMRGVSPSLQQSKVWKLKCVY